MLGLLPCGRYWALQREVFSQAWYVHCFRWDTTVLKLTEKVLYLSAFYRRGDLALRIGLFYTAASLSGAFGGKHHHGLLWSEILTSLGLLARGLAEIGPRGGIEGWRWILIIEGLLVSQLIPLADPYA